MVGPAANGTAASTHHPKQRRATGSRSRSRSTSRPPVMSKKLPEKWSRYRNIGQRVAGTRFVPFKTPLDDSYFNDKVIPAGDKLTLKKLMEELRAQGTDIGLVIDLTTSFKYYDPAGWANYGIEYRKLRCDATRILDRRKDFHDIVDDYLAREKDKLIGVHCAHGLNRTGFLVCAYMVERLGIPMPAAVTAFETARGHKIETSLDKLQALDQLLSSQASNE
uniref:TYR_PHOSPHATASE_2 domain-containing protein n=1 Tax=Panagrellus redivivus TaxID=6233 RepID=A0A7E4WAA2_PANRE